jgi:hypothetical protein
MWNGIAPTHWTASSIIKIFTQKSKFLGIDAVQN